MSVTNLEIAKVLLLALYTGTILEEAHESGSVSLDESEVQFLTELNAEFGLDRVDEGLYADIVRLGTGAVMPTVPWFGKMEAYTVQLHGMAVKHDRGEEIRLTRGALDTLQPILDALRDIRAD